MFRFKPEGDEFAVLSGGNFTPVVIFGDVWDSFSLSLLVSREMTASAAEDP